MALSRRLSSGGCRAWASPSPTRLAVVGVISEVKEFPIHRCNLGAVECQLRAAQEFFALLRLDPIIGALQRTQSYRRSLGQVVRWDHDLRLQTVNNHVA